MLNRTIAKIEKIMSKTKEQRERLAVLLLVVALVVGSLFAFNSIAADKRIAEVEQSWSKTTFHCNTHGGNPRVWPQVGPYNKNNDGKIFLVLEEIKGTTAWYLIDVKDAKGNSLGVPECPGKHAHCGSCEWISFSNNSGAPDGKNIQLHHGKPGDVPTEGKGKIELSKTVDGQLIAKWFTDNNVDKTSIINSMSFELYAVDTDGVTLKGNPVSVGKVGPDGKINFNPQTVPAGWYAVVEKLTGKAAEIFEATEPFYVYVNSNGMGSSITNENIEGIFTVQYTYGYALDVQLVYDDGGIIKGQKPDGSGQQLSTERFDVRMPDGTVVPSFCADIGAHNVFGSYKFDSTFHGLSADQRLHMTAAFDYIHATLGLDTNPGKALAQIVLWNLLDDEGYAVSYRPDNKIVKIEGSGDWYAPYSDLVDDLINNPSKYISMYPNNPSSFVSGMVCIVGNDDNYSQIDQQRQMLPLFNGIAFENKIKEKPPVNPPVEKVVITNLNWNNGNTSDKNGANGAGINQFKVDNVTLKNNKNYVTPANFNTAVNKIPGKNDATQIYTVTERTVNENGKYVKVYDVKVAFYAAGIWKVYEGTITVDNPGGNDNNQKIDLLRIK